jgi:hypothetical protein
MNTLLKLTMILTLSAGIACAEVMPEAPAQQRARRPTKLDWVLLSADAAVRQVDVVSTRMMLERGNRELFLPSSIVNHAATMELYSGAVVAANWYASQLLIRSGHRRLARIVMAVDVAQDGFWAFHNFTLPNWKKR